MRRRISPSSAVASAIFRLRFARLRFTRQCVSEDGDAAEHQRNAQQYAHCQPAPEKAELNVGLAKQFADDARHAVAERKTSGDDAGTLQGAAAHHETEHDEEDDAFQRCFIKLAGMRGIGPPLGKIIAHGTSLGRPHNSPLMKLAMRPRNSPIGQTAAMTSPSDSIGMPRLSANATMAMMEPATPP